MKIIDITDSEYPKQLLKIKNPPNKLYVEGNKKLLNNISIAIVGSRNCSEYGVEQTKRFSKIIASNNITVISGLAIGIDTVAHETAKQYNGNTIAVLGSGLKKIFPEENKKLFKDILESNGCIISEYDPNEDVNMENFPKRNRIISGISTGVLVIEAAFRSGSTITAKYGFEQDKKVFCIPRDIGVSNGVGSNNLIKKGAILVTNPEEILNELNIKYETSNIKLESKEIIEQNEEYRKVEVEIEKEYEDIDKLISYTPQNIQQISIKSGLEISDINQKLTILELKGLIKSLPGNNYVRV